MDKPSILYHCTTQKKAKAYRASGKIHAPVRGFDNHVAALAWCVKTGRTVIYEIKGETENLHKLPDHHNIYGFAWWYDQHITEFKCFFSAETDA